MKFEQYKDRAIITVHSDGPRGPQGIQGPKGDKGDKGDAGEVTQEEFDQQKDAINLKVAKVEDDLVTHKEDYANLVNDVDKHKFLLINEIKNGDFSNGTTNWSQLLSTISVTDNTLKILSTGGGANAHAYQVTDVDMLANKKVHVSFKCKVSSNNIKRIAVAYNGDTNADLNYLVPTTIITNPVANQEYDISTIITLDTKNNNTGKMRLFIRMESDTVALASGTYSTIQSVKVIDLTNTFGVGKEPASIADLNNVLPTVWFDEELDIFNGRDEYLKTLKAYQGVGRASTIIVASASSSLKSKNGADFICTGINDEIIIQNAINSLPSTGGKITLLEGNYLKSNATGMSLPSNVEIEILAGATLKLADNLNADACFFTNADKVNGNSNISIFGGGIIDCNFRKQTVGTYQYIADFEMVSCGKIDIYIKNYTMLEAKLKQSNVSISNRKFKQKPYILAPCEDISEFKVINGTAITEIGTGVIGNNCIKLTVGTSAATIDKVIPTNIENNFDAYEVDMYIKIDNPLAITSLVLGADIGSGADELQVRFSNTEIAKTFTPSKWSHIRVPLNRYILATIPTFRISATASSETFLYVDKITLVPVRTKPELSWVYDDALGSASGAPTIPGIKLMAKYGHRGAIAQMGANYVGKAGEFLTVEELDLSCFEYGWDICVHTYDHLENNVPFETAINTLKENKQYIESNGWKGSNFIVFAGHDTRGEITDAIKKIFNNVRNPMVEGYQPPVTRLGRVNIARQITDVVITEKEKALLRRHGYLHHFSHGLGGTQISATQLESWCQFWFNWGLISKPPSEVESKVF